MPYDPTMVKPGDPLVAADTNADRSEIRRLGGIRTGAGLTGRQGAGGLALTSINPERIFMKLTGTALSAAYPWQQVVHQAPNTWITTGVTGSTSLDPAYERQMGDTTLTVDGTVYEATRSPTSGVWLFDGKN